MLWDCCSKWLVCLPSGRPGLILIDRHCVGSVFYEPIMYACFMFIFSVDRDKKLKTETHRVSPSFWLSHGNTVLNSLSLGYILLFNFTVVWVYIQNPIIISFEYIISKIFINILYNVVGSSPGITHSRESYSQLKVFIAVG